MGTHIIPSQRYFKKNEFQFPKMIYAKQKYFTNLDAPEIPWKGPWTNSGRGPPWTAAGRSEVIKVSLMRWPNPGDLTFWGDWKWYKNQSNLYVEYMEYQIYYTVCCCFFNIISFNCSMSICSPFFFAVAVVASILWENPNHRRLSTFQHR